MIDASELRLLRQIADGHTSFTPEEGESPAHPDWLRRISAIEQLQAAGYVSGVRAVLDSMRSEAGILKLVVADGVTEEGRERLRQE